MSPYGRHLSTRSIQLSLGEDKFLGKALHEGATVPLQGGIYIERPVRKHRITTSGLSMSKGTAGAEERGDG